MTEKKASSTHSRRNEKPDALLKKIKKKNPQPGMCVVVTFFFDLWNPLRWLIETIYFHATPNMRELNMFFSGFPAQ